MNEKIEAYKKIFDSVRNNIDKCNADRLGESGADFYLRMYNSDPDLYYKKVLSLGFENKKHVLDLGCGVGQWSFCLASCNERVTAMDVSSERVEIVNELKILSNVNNLEAKSGSGEDIPIEDESFDAVFCFAVMHYLDTRKLLCEAYRVLETGGLLYIIGKDVGGYLYFLEQNPGATNYYSPEKSAIDAFINTYFLKRFNQLPDYTDNTDRIVSCEEFCALASEIGFEVIAYGPEGSVSLDERLSPVNYFTTEYKGYPKCYEVVIKKK